MKIRKSVPVANGDRIVGSLPHNKEAIALYSNKVSEERQRLEEYASKLLAEKELRYSVNGYGLHFYIEDKILYTTYEFQDGGEATDLIKFDSYFNNNDSLTELFLALAKAECNAELSSSTYQIILFNYPAFAFYASEQESKTLKFKLRQLTKHPFFLRFM